VGWALRQYLKICNLVKIVLFFKCDYHDNKECKTWLI
jgi:hypothetical protein